VRRAVVRSIYGLSIVVAAVVVVGVAQPNGAFTTDHYLDGNTGRRREVTVRFFVTVSDLTEETWLSNVIDPEQKIQPDWHRTKRSIARINYRWAAAWTAAQNIEYARKLNLMDQVAFEACCFALIEGWSRLDNPRDLDPILLDFWEFVRMYEDKSPATFTDIEPFLGRLRAEG